MKKGKLNLDKHSKKRMKTSFILQGIYCGLCLVAILLCLIENLISHTALGDFILFKALPLMTVGLLLGNAPVIIANLLLCLFGFPMERGKKSILWILWTILSPLFDIVFYFAVVGVFVLTTGGV